MMMMMMMMMKTRITVKQTDREIQLTTALTDFKGPTIFICYRWISVIANIEIKEKLFKGPKNSFCNRRISITGGPVRAGFNFTLIHITITINETLQLMNVYSRHGRSSFLSGLGRYRNFHDLSRYGAG